MDILQCPHARLDLYVHSLVGLSTTVTIHGRKTFGGWTEDVVSQQEIAVLLGVTDRVMSFWPQQNL